MRLALLFDCPWIQSHEVRIHRTEYSTCKSVKSPYEFQSRLFVFLQIFLEALRSSLWVRRKGMLGSLSAPRGRKNEEGSTQRIVQCHQRMDAYLRIHLHHLAPWPPRRDDRTYGTYIYPFIYISLTYPYLSRTCV
jgi:hypothetical protein